METMFLACNNKMQSLKKRFGGTNTLDGKIKTIANLKRPKWKAFAETLLGTSLIDPGVQMGRTFCRSDAWPFVAMFPEEFSFGRRLILRYSTLCYSTSTYLNRSFFSLPLHMPNTYRGANEQCSFFSVKNQPFAYADLIVTHFFPLHLKHSSDLSCALLHASEV